MSEQESTRTTQTPPEKLKTRTLFHRKYSRGKDGRTATPYDEYWSFAHAVRDLVIDRFVATQQHYLDRDVKRLYYFSMEYLVGRLLKSNLLALDMLGPGREALGQLGLNPEAMFERDTEAGLGNGGLGRLAACYMDSLATLEYPAYGYGLRYEHGIFRQEFQEGWQRERPDDWLSTGYPWEMVRPEYVQPVCVYGRLEDVRDPHGGTFQVWTDWQMFEGVPYDIPVIGYKVNTVNMLRLWSARAAEGFQLDVFNQGDYVRAVEEKNWAENVTKVLYPSDNTQAGRELRLIQEYFLVTCSIRDLVRRYLKNHHDWEDFPEKNAIQMNDTHPALAVAELMNVLCYEHDVPWDKAWDLTVRTLGFTNHTLLPEALEEWSEDLLRRVLPRHMEIIYRINHQFLQRVQLSRPGNDALLQKVSLIEEGERKKVRMAHLAVVGSHAVNGVSELHSRLVRERVMPEFADLKPDRFINITNGITHRRWLVQCNPELAELITSRIGDEWIYDLEQLKRLEPEIEDPDFRTRFLEIKHRNKARLAEYIHETTGVDVPPDSLFDVQIKRLHMYKRQLLNAMHIITLYRRLKHNPGMEITPRTFIFGAKAAPAYLLAKRVIKLINTLGDVINKDPEVDGRLKVVFLPDYNVSLAEKIIPAADLSEQISMAGKEASGTGNMKLALNGALTIGTWDGANIEIAEHVGEENIFIFGRREEEFEDLRRDGYNPWQYYDRNPELKGVLDSLKDNEYEPEDPDVFRELFDELTAHGDPFFYLADYRDYIETQQRVAECYRDRERWCRATLLNVARMGWFSSDRAVRQYAEKVWNLEPVEVRDVGRIST
ncbi:glycogen/starch/alpha-glucan phosphorylase [Kiritimatiella glycovorans]|uniref:Alpha-1,4 glucan phosphorylase n=1 Tax=Kiritimatiella glycovorans TaxID=1307763 RepID=A0A0G3EDY2_9BACT|nr:glycogen/starch/alpha-glucan phosphorylase [Kiritimatiella glycovorans]AKJ64518.1 Maltodextrin phosphorylase [Kiritimatiella glycovorans]